MKSKKRNPSQLRRNRVEFPGNARGKRGKRGKKDKSKPLTVKGIHDRVRDKPLTVKV